MVCYCYCIWVVIVLGSFNALRSYETSQVGFDKKIRNIQADERKLICNEKNVYI